MLKDLYLGTSIAISWAWGTSLILGMQIAQQKGLEAFLIWAIANCLTLGIFGILYKQKIIFPRVLDQRIVQIFTSLIQCFCLIIQLKILNETLLNFTTPLNSYLLTAGFGCILTIWMYKRGLSASIFTDLFQGILTISLLIISLIYCWNQGIETIPSTYSSGSDILWGIWSACILLCGIMTDIQHWQRAEVNKDGHAFEAATLFFALYLLCVLLLSKFKFDSTLNTLLLFTVIGVTTSTIDSIAVALHRNFGRKLGTLIGLGICLSFGLLIQLSVLSIWSYFGVIRVGLACYILYWCYKNHGTL